jgi:hypothetical protein
MKRVFKKELYNGIPNVTVWRVLRRRLHLKVYKVSIVQYLERRIVCVRNTRHTVTFGIQL